MYVLKLNIPKVLLVSVIKSPKFKAISEISRKMLAVNSCRTQEWQGKEMKK